ncbi:MAG: hypothetical protein AMXMBFR53_07080 [Gemmatimonadota bacterium]
MRRFRIFVLGAGFSKPAGLPLGPELWQEIKARASRGAGRASKFDRDLDLYLRYLRDTGRSVGTDDDVDFEGFLGFLDIEHRLGLAGSDTWSEEGNETQIIVKRVIGQIICERTPPAEHLPAPYYAFAEQLKPGDFVLTFNYDNLLERALEHVGQSYRLFPDRYSRLHDYHAEVSDEGRDEVVVLKLHGSIDWFDRSRYDEREAARRKHGLTSPTEDPVFGPNRNLRLVPLTEGPRFPDDELQTVYRVVEGIESVYAGPHFLGGTPVLLSPSTAKAIYADRFRSFWWGMGRGGGMNLGIGIIGYSLPHHDEYAGQALFRLLRNYQDSWWDESFFEGQRKEKVIFIDRRPEGTERDSLRQRFGFLDEEKTAFRWTGFDSEAVEMIRRGVAST